ncbi:ABC transporter ATP-binding protein [Nocardioidaceae bacterium SCSIO 66511]|nr:ABC transporter ATP-binding protein [Nocardioidaceae bacterium SCSIO 66511]
MPDIRLSGICKDFGSARAVDDLDLTIPDGSFTCLLGPSGCGKTTTLRIISGLEHPTDGELAMDDRVLDSVAAGTFVPPERRDMGLVFQSYALWPHLTVRENTEFGLRMRRLGHAERDARVDETLRLVRIDDVADRYPAQLSGGQQQRVALARMLAMRPKVLLLDEPLSNLDAQLRLEMRTELKRIHDELDTTIVFVTHDQLEAMTLATDVAVMNNGRLEQFAPPLEVYGRPASEFVARFVGSPPMNLISLAGDRLGASLNAYTSAFGPGRTDIESVGIRPEALQLGSSAAGTGCWQETATVETILPTGYAWIVRLSVLDGTVFAVAFAEDGLRPGATVRFHVEAADIHLFDNGGRRAGSVAGDDRDAAAESMRDSTEVA